MDTNGLVFIGFIFFEAIKQILYCFLTIYSHNLTTMPFGNQIHWEELLFGIVSEQWQRVSFLLRNKLLMLRYRKTETGSYGSFYDILFAQCMNGGIQHSQ